MYRFFFITGIIVSFGLSTFASGNNDRKNAKESGHITTNISDRLALFNIRFMPIPSKKEIILSYSLEKLRHINISVLNEIGQVMAEKTFDDQSKGSYFFPIDIAQLHKGIYQLRLKIDEFMMTEELVIEEK